MDLDCRRLVQVLYHIHLELILLDFNSFYTLDSLFLLQNSDCKLLDHFLLYQVKLKRLVDDLSLSIQDHPFRQCFYDCNHQDQVTFKDF